MADWLQMRANRKDSTCPGPLVSLPLWLLARSIEGFNFIGEYLYTFNLSLLSLFFSIRALYISVVLFIY